MTLDEAKRLGYGQVVYHVRLRNADGSPLRARVTGRVQTWKRDPSRVRVPVKHGMYDAGAIEPWNLDQFVMSEEIACRVNPCERPKRPSKRPPRPRQKALL